MTAANSISIFFQKFFSKKALSGRPSFERLLFTIGDPNRPAGFFTLAVGRSELSTKDIAYATELSKKYGSGYISRQVFFEQVFCNSFGRTEITRRIEEEEFLQYVHAV